MTDTRRLPWQLENRIKMKHADAFYRLWAEAHAADKASRLKGVFIYAGDWAMRRTLDLILRELYDWYGPDEAFNVSMEFSPADLCYQLRIANMGKTVAVYMQYSWHRIGLHKALEACGVQYSYQHWPPYIGRPQLQPIS